MAEADRAATAATDPTAASKDVETTKGGKESASRDPRPYTVVLLEAVEALVRGAPDRATLASIVSTLNTARENGAAAALPAGAAASLTSRPGRVGAGAQAAPCTTPAGVISEAMRSCLEPLFVRLVADDTAPTAKEAEVCMRIIRALGVHLPAEACQDHADWALEQCHRQTGPCCMTGLARSLVAHWIALSSRGQAGLTTSATTVLEEVRHHMCQLPTDDDPDPEPLDQAPHSLLTIHEANANAIAIIALDQLDGVVTDVERALVVLKRVLPAAKGASGGAAAQPTQGESALPPQHPAFELERATLQRMLDLEPALLTCTTTQLAGSSAEHALRCLEKFYRALGSAFTIASSMNHLHERIVELHWQRLSRNIYQFLSYQAQNEQEYSGVDRKRTKREVRLVPALVFRIEQFESLLVRISKKFKVDLTTEMRRSTARDFRINLSKIEEIEKENEEALAQSKSKKRRGKGKAADDDDADAEMPSGSPEEVDDDE